PRHAGRKRPRRAGAADARSDAMRWWVVAAVVALVACEGAEVPVATFTPTNAPPRTPARRAPESIEVFTSGAPARPYVDIGFIEVKESDQNQGTDALFRAMRGVAGDRGCDGVIVLGSADETSIA